MAVMIARDELIFCVLRIEVGPAFEPVVGGVECSDVSYLVKPCGSLASE